jgi:hypothetical protein
MFAYWTYVIALVASVLWFTAALRYFGFQHVTAAKVLIPQSQRASPVFMTIAASLRFLGGMNGAFAVLSAALLIAALSGSALFADPKERAVLLLVLAAAHVSQFLFNVPVLLGGERRGDSYWNVVSGPMLFIFVIDAVETLICLVAAGLQFYP